MRNYRVNGARPERQACKQLVSSCRTFLTRTSVALEAVRSHGLEGNRGASQEGSAAEVSSCFQACRPGRAPLTL